MRTTKAYSNNMSTATEKLEWIKDRIAEGRTVYLATALRVTSIKAKNLPCVRVRGENLEVQHGRKWLNHNWSRISAR